MAKETKTISYSDEYKEQILKSVDQATLLLGSGELRKNGRALQDIVQSIITASSLEDHLEVSQFGELIIGVVQGLVCGSLNPNSDTIRSAIIEALAEIRHIINTNTQAIDYNIKERMKTILGSAKSDQQDYIFDKVIKVLYIDEDKFAQHNIKKNIGKSIEIESCFTGEEAIEKLKRHTFDAILCDLKLSDTNITNVFKQYASKIPIVAISTFDDPKLVQLATRAGAMDFIVKNEMGIKWIPRSLNTVTKEWKKMDKSSTVRLFLDNPDTNKILKHFVNEGPSIKEKSESTLIYDWKTSDEIKDVSSSLESLVNAGYIKKQPTELTLVCPKCTSFKITAHYLCKDCKSSNFVKGDILEHNKCGYSAPEDKFRNTNKLICPKCNKELKLIGVDYFKVEAAYTCKKCNNFFTTPDLRYSCNDCGQLNFRISDGGWTQLYNYEVISDKINKIKQSMVSLVPIENFLSERGFSIESSINTNSNSKHSVRANFDLVARNQDQTIFVVMLGSDIEENFAKIVELDTTSKSIPGRVTKYAIMFSEPREMTRNILTKFGIVSIVAEDIREIAAKFKENYVVENINTK